MNLKYKFDSEGEYKFAKALDEDPNVLLYTKLKKGGFVIETPVGNYSPDWSIVYQKDNDQLAMYFIAETKWDKEAGDLSDDEKIKIRCATKHFEAVDGAMNDTVKSVKIDGTAASVETINSGEYKIARPFNIAYKDGLSETAQDFVSFIMSADGQSVIEEKGYIKVSDAPEYESTKQDGKITVAGSSSVTPVMEKLKEAYCELNPEVTIEINQSDSTTGMSAAADGICDIGMASRDLKDSELEKGLTPTVIAMDGIAVIVSNDNPVNELSSEQVKNIYTGDITSWESLISE